MFRSLSHEEERQGVTGEVEEPLPLPGGAGLRVRGEGCCCEVRREDGPNPVYVPHELGVFALHTSGCFECSEHVRPLPCAHGAGVFQQEYCRVLLVRQPVVKGVQGGGHALGEVSNIKSETLYPSHLQMHLQKLALSHMYV